ncbi:diaminopimelate decarboxylase [Sulfurifustis variabilis]|uniref:Diaminopimelate decarboxylase n=1 Tax=Sulfurifustis variabilis TaxID=1675686 RepID=A0A1B4V1E1_9GAMM|nr:diaminopimelate decarboxylase [Sulfurifustis variabilis]BAU47095.1 diaminopimelate decarboxylase [Sulfurifustis variabilis]
MNPFGYRNGRLHAEDVDLADLARETGTPCYVYSRSAIEERWRAFDEAFTGRDHLVCYAVKANSNLAVLDALARLGSGFDIVSGGELERVLAAGGDPARTVFSGVGKTPEEMRRALEVGIACFNVESEPELQTLNAVAGAVGRRAPVSLRVNPDVDPATHPYIATGLKESKFGIDIAAARAVYRRARGLEHIVVKGVASHIGSQLTDVSPFVLALERVMELVGDLMDDGFDLEHLDLGGGLGIRYADETPPEPVDYALALLDRLQRFGSRYQRLKLLIEPGRAIVGNAGLLLTRVLYLKHAADRSFAVVDAAMNDLLRPALYDAWHDIAPLQLDESRERRVYDIVGPVCESGDFLGHARELAIAPGDLLVVASAGAYGAVMSSNYNTRPRVPEVMVDGDRYHVVRRRESVSDLLAPESRLPG